LRVRANTMLKISILDTPSYRCLVIEGKLMAPWASELMTVWQQATANLGGRKLVVDVKSLTCISGDGENVLLELMKQGAKFRSAGVFTKHILKRLGNEIRRNEEEKI
jgi:anti-anti-sigma regulatory factor